MLFNSLILLLLSNSITSRRDKSILFWRTTIIILIIWGCTACYILYILFLAKGIGINGMLFHTTANTNSFNFWFIPFHFWFILLFLYFQKQRITVKKLINLTIIVIVIPLILHFINFSLPYLIDNLPFILFEFNNLISRILVFFVSRMHQVLLKIFSKKGFIDILTSICIIYVIKILFLSSLSLLNIVSNLFITNWFFSLTIELYSITLIKLVMPYVENLVIPYVENLVIPCVEGIFISIIKPFFGSYLSHIHCDSPEVVAKLFSELPFSNVDSNVMIKECRTSTHYKSRQDLIAEFKAFRLKISLYTPSIIVSMESGHVSNIEQGEPSRGQLFNVKKRALYNTQEEGYNKRAKIDLGNNKWTTVTSEDFDGEYWDLHSIYDKINNLMEDPNYNRKWEISKLFEDKELQHHFYNYIKVFELTSWKNVRHTPLVHLKKNLEEQIKTEYDPYSIKRGDFTENSLNLISVYKKITKIVEKEDFNIGWKLSKLKFEPSNLRLPFYATIEALNLNVCKNAYSMTISALKNRISEEFSLIHHTPNSITRDDFTKDGLKLENIYNKIKQSLEDGQCKKTDIINKLFPPNSQIKLDFCNKLRTLNLIDPNFKNTQNIRIQTLINLLEKVVDVPCTKDNSITREDLRGEDWDLYSIHAKIKNLMEDPNFNRKSRISKLEFEPAILRKEFYAYIQNFNLTKDKSTSHTTIVTLKNNLEKHFKYNES